MSLNSLKGTEYGFTLIEVLITLVIVAIGLFGLAGLQMNSLQNQLEAYQRAQAVLLVEDMANRIRVNAKSARDDGAYTPGTDYGLKADTNCDPNTMAIGDYDLCAWDVNIKGQGVTLAGSEVGSINAARGCIENVLDSKDGESIIRVTVAWQGTSATKAPISTCGINSYGDDDKFRRVVSLDTVLADLAD